MCSRKDSSCGKLEFSQFKHSPKLPISLSVHLVNIYLASSYNGPSPRGLLSWEPDWQESCCQEAQEQSWKPQEQWECQTRDLVQELFLEEETLKVRTEGCIGGSQAKRGWEANPGLNGCSVESEGKSEGLGHRGVGRVRAGKDHGECFGFCALL